MLAKPIVLFVIAAFFGAACASQPGDGSPLSGADARRLVQEGALLLDVRTPEEFAEGHIDGALNIPVQVLEQRMAEVGDKAHAVVVYCRSGRRSAQAAGMLSAAGYSKVHDLGPMSRW